MYDKLFDAGVRVKLDDRNETIGYKIREARQQDRATYMIILGAKEIETGTLSVRELATDKTTAYGVDEFIAKVVDKIKNRK